MNKLNLFFAAIILLIGYLASSQLAFAQTTEAGSTAAPAVDDIEAPAEQPSVLKMLFGGNVFGVVIVSVILFLSVLSVFFIIDHVVKIRRGRLMPETVMLEIERQIVHGEVGKAIAICKDKDNYCMATEVIVAGLDLSLIHI